MLLTLLKGEAKDHFQVAHSSSTARNEENKLNEALNALAKHIFNDDGDAWRRQRNCMRHHLFFLEGQFKTFKERLAELNGCLKCFPIPPERTDVKSLEEDELLEIID